MTTTAKFGEILKQILLDRIAADNLVLPTLPRVATQVADLIRGSDVDLKGAAQALDFEPILTAMVLRKVGGGSLGGADQISSAAQALGVLGVPKVKDLFQEAVSRQVFMSREPSISAALEEIWVHSVAVAVLARDLAALVGAEGTDDAYMVGLLHDVGKPIVALVMLEFEGMAAATQRQVKFTKDEWLGVISDIHRPVAVALAEKWGLPKNVRAVIESVDDFDVGGGICTANLVRFANALTKKVGVSVGEFDETDADAVLMIGKSLMDIDDDMASRLAKGLGVRVAESMPKEE